MIMAKFSALAKIQSSSVAQDGAETAIKLLECPSASGEPAEEACDEASMAMMHEADTGLSEEQLLEVFKQVRLRWREIREPARINLDFLESLRLATCRRPSSTSERLWPATRRCGKSTI